MNHRKHVLVEQQDNHWSPLSINGNFFQDKKWISLGYKLKKPWLSSFIPIRRRLFSWRCNLSLSNGKIVVILITDSWKKMTLGLSNLSDVHPDDIIHTLAKPLFLYLQIPSDERVFTAKITRDNTEWEIDPEFSMIIESRWEEAKRIVEEHSDLL